MVACRDERSESASSDDDGLPAATSYMALFDRREAPVDTAKKATEALERREWSFMQMFSRRASVSKGSSDGDHPGNSNEGPSVVGSSYRGGASSMGMGSDGWAKPEWQLINDRVEANPVEAERRLQLLRQLAASVGAPPALLESAFLRGCLRAKKQDPQKAAALVKSYESFRQKAGWTTTRSVSAAELRPELQTAFNLILPHTDRYGHTVVTQTMSLLDLSLRGTSMER